MATDNQTHSAQALCVIFGYKNSREVSELLTQHRIEPLRYSAGNGMRRVPEWRIRDAAPILCKLTEEQISEKIRLLHHSQLPPKLTMLYWSGEAARLKVQELEGNLWPTERVKDVFAGALKAMRIGLLLIPDRLQQVKGLSHEHHRTTTDLLNNTLADLKRRLEDFFIESKRDGYADTGGFDVFGEEEDEPI